MNKTMRKKRLCAVEYIPPENLPPCAIKRRLILVLRLVFLCIWEINAAHVNKYIIPPTKRFCFRVFMSDNSWRLCVFGCLFLWLHAPFFCLFLLISRLSFYGHTHTQTLTHTRTNGEQDLRPRVPDESRKRKKRVFNKLLEHHSIETTQFVLSGC